MNKEMLYVRYEDMDVERLLKDYESLEGVFCTLRTGDYSKENTANIKERLCVMASVLMSKGFASRVKDIRITARTEADIAVVQKLHEKAMLDALNKVYSRIRSMAR